MPSTSSRETCVRMRTMSLCAFGGEVKVGCHSRMGFQCGKSEVSSERKHEIFRLPEFSSGSRLSVRSHAIGLRFSLKKTFDFLLGKTSKCPVCPRISVHAFLSKGRDDMAVYLFRRQPRGALSLQPDITECRLRCSSWFSRELRTDSSYRFLQGSCFLGAYLPARVRCSSLAHHRKTANSPFPSASCLFLPIVGQSANR